MSSSTDTSIRDAASADLAPDDRLDRLRGIGTRRMAQLERLGLRTVRDLAFFLPRSYDQRPPVSPIASLTPEMRAAVIGEVEAITIRRRRRGQRDLVARVNDGSGSLDVVWYHQAYLAEQLPAGTRLALWGTVGRQHPLAMQSPEFEVLPEPATTLVVGGPHPEREWRDGSLCPIYRLTDGIGQKQMRRLVAVALEIAAPRLVESLEPSIRQRQALPRLQDALRMLHAPASLGDVQRGRERLVFDEFLALQLGLARWRRDRDRGPAGVSMPGGARLREARRALPFQLTRGQRRALAAILEDMASTRVMHRLLEGDVGCGKTVVALLAAVAAADAGCQAALMVPTEILAAQHARSVAELFPTLRAAVLTGSTGGRERRRLLASLAAGEIELTIGTHALFGEAVRFRRLGLVIIDEQHRFGVAQRAALHAKGERPDMLVMTATPIPRSLALTCFGDLDLTLIDQRPPGRQPARTYVAESGHRDRVLRYLDQTIAAGGQVVVITPRIDPGETAELIAATQAIDALRRHPLLGRRRLELVHGRLPWEEKEAVLEALRQGEIDLLVSTTVVEVGLDVPGLRVVVIERPECFGLSQLHQLRGRVGRGRRQGECILQLDERTPPASRDRLRQFARTRDGFQVAAMDLETRGVGDLLGHQQHGWDGFAVADLVRDRQLLEAARRTALELLQDDPDLERHPALRTELERCLDPGSGSCISGDDVLSG